MFVGFFGTVSVGFSCVLLMVSSLADDMSVAITLAAIFLPVLFGVLSALLYLTLCVLADMLSLGMNPFESGAWRAQAWCFYWSEADRLRHWSARGVSRFLGAAYFRARFMAFWLDAHAPRDYGVSYALVERPSC
jgi:hypothetical protein